VVAVVEDAVVVSLEAKQVIWKFNEKKRVWTADK